MSRVFVYIDGRNFFYGLRSSDINYTDLNFDFVKFSNLIKGCNQKDRSLNKIYYYNAPLKQQINPYLFREQQKLFSRLSLDPLVEMRLCKMIGRIDDKGREKFVTKGDDI